MPRRTWRRAPEQLPRPLLPAAARPLAAALLAACVAVTVLLGAWFRHHTRAGWLDSAVDVRVQASLGGHLATLNLLAGLGDPVPVTAMTAALLLACLATRRWRGAVLVTVAVPAAAALTQLLLKPLIGRTLQGDLSFPSGTATGVFALAAAFAVLLACPLRPRMPAALRLLLALAAVLAAGAVAVALVGLGIHYFTDTVGGAAVGTAVVLATALILDRLGPSRQWLRQYPRRPPVPVRAETPTTLDIRTSADPCVARPCLWARRSPRSAPITGSAVTPRRPRRSAS